MIERISGVVKGDGGGAEGIHTQGLSTMGWNRHTITCTDPLANGYLKHYHLITCVTLTAKYSSESLELE